MHLVDHARQYIEETYERPAFDRFLRGLLGIILPKPNLFRLALIGAVLAKPLKGLFRGRIRAMLDMAPTKLEPPSALDGIEQHLPTVPRKKRVALMTGCAQKVLAPDINDSTIRLLTRHGVEVIIPKVAGCCGALPLHMGKEDNALDLARENIRAWSTEIEGEGLDAILINTSGCGTTVKDYGHLFENDSELSVKAAEVAELACDITEFLPQLDMQKTADIPPLKIAYHSACSLQHGQKIKEPPKQLLAAMDFQVIDIPESHICCGSAGTYNLLQPEMSGKLKARKVANIAKTNPEVIAAGNIGCIAQIASGMDLPVLHTVHLLDWATGGPTPEPLK